MEVAVCAEGEYFCAHLKAVMKVMGREYYRWSMRHFCIVTDTGAVSIVNGSSALIIVTGFSVLSILTGSSFLSFL